MLRRTWDSLTFDQASDASADELPSVLSVSSCALIGQFSVSLKGGGVSLASFHTQHVSVDQVLLIRSIIWSQSDEVM